MPADDNRANGDRPSALRRGGVTALVAGAAPLAVAVLAVIAVWRLPAGQDGIGASSRAGQAIMAVLGLPLVLFLPGLCLSFALTGRRLGAGARLTLAVTLSLATTVIGGLVLTRLPGGLTRTSWTLWGAGTVTLFWIIAAVRGWRAANTPSEVPVWRSIRSQAMPAAIGVLAVAVAAGAVTLAVIKARDVPKTGFTELSVAPGGIVVGGRREIIVAVHDVDDGSSRYRLMIHTGTVPLGQWEISLQPGREKLMSVSVTRGKRVVVELYRGGALYRHVSLNVA
jgi:uncharacterized membrane protein